MAAITRASTLTEASPPIRRMVPVSSTRSSLTCNSIGISVISSSSSVPAEARSKWPRRCWVAPVKLPRSWPNSSLSISPAGMAPQLSGRNGPRRRLLISWMVCATISLPVPLSPVSRTDASVGATLAIRS